MRSPQQLLTQITDPPTWGVPAWAAVIVAVSQARFDLGLGDASLASAAALACGAFIGSNRAVRATAAAAVGMIALALWRGDLQASDVGFMVGLVVTAALAARLAPAGEPPVRGPAVWLPLGSAALVAAAAAGAWQPAAGGLPLDRYYRAVLMLSLVIAGYYSLRLVARPARVLSLATALVPYWGLGIAAAIVAGEASLVDAAFHGLVSRIPGDALGAVLVAALTDPHQRITGRTPR